MIIITDAPNQLGNRLKSYSSFIAFGIKYNKRVWILDFHDYSNLFQNLNSHPNIKWGLFNNKKMDSISRRILLKSFRILGYIFNPSIFNIYTGKESLDKEKLKCSIVFINTWPYHVRAFRWIPVKEYRKELREIFIPGDKTLEKVRNHFNEFKSRFDKVVGIHIRRGDYKTYKNGIYYFSNEVYYNYMKEIQRQLSGQGIQNVGFLICSDERIELKNFDGLNVFQIKDAILIDDLYALSECDYIIGPPSTFSEWASFYGSVPLRVIENGVETVLLNQFHIVSYSIESLEINEA